MTLSRWIPLVWTVLFALPVTMTPTATAVLSSCVAPCSLDCDDHHRYLVVAQGGGSGLNGGKFVCRQLDNDFTIAECTYTNGNPKFGGCVAQGEWPTNASGLDGTCSVIGTAEVRCTDLGPTPPHGLSA